MLGIQNGEIYLSLKIFSRLPVMCITFWFNAYSIIKISFSSTFVEAFSVWEGDFNFYYIFQTMEIKILATREERTCYVPGGKGVRE